MWNWHKVAAITIFVAGALGAIALGQIGLAGFLAGAASTLAIPSGKNGNGQQEKTP